MGLALASGSLFAAAAVVSPIGLGGDLFAVHLELLPGRAGGRYGEPHDEVADQEDAEQVAEQRAEPAQEGDAPEACEQQGQEERQTHPDGVEVEVAADAGAHASQFGVFGVAVEAARDPRSLGLQVGIRAFGDVFGRTHLPDDVHDQRFLDDAGVVLHREDQFGDAGLDVGDDLRTVGRFPVRALEAFEVGGELLIGVGVQCERHTRYAAFLDFFHGFADCVVVGGAGLVSGLRCRRSIW